MPNRHGHIIIENMRIDVEALQALAHRCEPLKCIGRARGCCETYEVVVGRREQGTIVGALAEASRFASGLKADGKYLDPFEETEGGSCLNTDEDGRCVFAYEDARGATLCSLHSAALELGLPPAQVKPRACALWPLALVEGDPPLLTVQEGVLDFPCNRRRRNGAAGLNGDIAEIIEAVFGRELLTELLLQLALPASPHRSPTSCCDGG